MSSHRRTEHCSTIHTQHQLLKHLRDATQLEDKLYSIYAVPNCAEAGKAFPTPKTFEEYRKQIEEEKLAKEVARKRKEIAEGERDVAKVAEADAVGVSALSEPRRGVL